MLYEAPPGPHTNRRDDRNEVLFDQRLHDLRIDRFDAAHMADVDDLRHVGLGSGLAEVELLCPDQIAVLTRDAHGATAVGVDDRYDVLIHESTQHHLDHIHGLGIGNAHAADELGGYVQTLQEVADLGSTAVDDNGIQTHQLQEDNVSGEGVLQALVDHGVATVLDHQAGAVKALDVGQRLGENRRDARSLLVGYGHWQRLS